MALPRELQEIVDRAKAGELSVEDIRAWVEKNPEKLTDLSDSVRTDFRMALYDVDPALSEPVGSFDIQTGVAPILGGSATASIKYLTGEAAGTEVTRNVVQSEVGRSLLKNALGLIFGRSKTGMAIRGIAGIGLFNSIIGDGGQPPEGEGGVTTGPAPEGEGGQTTAQGPRGPTIQSALGPIPELGFAPGTMVRPTSGNLAGVQVGSNAPSSQPNLPVDPGFNIMVIDHSGELTGTPGAVAVVTSGELGLSPNVGAIDPSLIDAASPTGDPIADYLAASLAAGASTSTIGGREVIQTVFPESLGAVKISSPVQVQAQAPTVTAQTPISQFRPGPPANVDPNFWKINTEDLPPDQMENPPINVPAGAQIAPRIFSQYRGRTLLEWASIAAQRNGVPLSLLYGLIDHESNWLSNAVGDNGTSFGLAQIHLPAWPNITQAQANNPVFALEWTAQKLRERFQVYGRWDAAVAAHNSPVAAQYLARTGQFYNDKSANYTGDVLRRANISGLGAYLFPEDTELPPTAGASTGPEYTPFQAPDPAQSREYIRGVYEELLKRQPTEDELREGVSKINSLARSAYNANLRQAKGGESQAVDIESQFLEGIRDTGEFAYREDVSNTRKFTDFAAGIARMMQEGI